MVFMSRTSIVTIGNEILSGITVNTNAAYLADKLLLLGISTVSSYTVADELDSIAQALEAAVEDAELVITTGGLGPTSDDLTRQALAKFLGVELELKKELMEKIENFFIRIGQQMRENTKQQAYLPAGTTALENKIGTAPGIRAEKNEKLIFCLPGVPAEMKRMFESSVLEELAQIVKKSNQSLTVLRKVKCFGEGESTIAEMLEPFCARDRNPLINFTADCGVITVHIVARGKDYNEVTRIAEAEQEKLVERLGELVFSTDEKDLAEVVGCQLIELRKTLAVAESCTGGLLAEIITAVPGASNYFTHGWITYSNDAKINELGVDADLIKRYGSVSGEVAEAMAKGARLRAKTDVSVAITGIAGPSGGTEQKPVGLVYISVDSSFYSETKRFIFAAGRASIRLRSANAALNMVRLALQKLT